ncbi:MAG: lysophospholipid acyltransferase family protein [Woeseiaceae bacterium]
MSLFLRSLLFNAYGLFSAILHALVILLLFWAPERVRVNVCRHYCSNMMTVADQLCGIKIIVEGRENLPDTPSVLMIKHTSTMETLWQVSEFPQAVWVLKQEMLSVPIIGWAIVLANNPIGVNRKKGRSAVKQVISKGSERLAHGAWITIFPEGTRMPPGETRRYGVSGAALARDASVPLVPIAHNAADFWPRRSFSKHPGTVRFCIGPPVDATQQEPKQTNLIVQYWIEAKMREISSAYQDQ